jgi:muconate cycloisomerase
MLDTATSGVQGDLVVRKLTSTIVDVPTVRKHKLSQTSVTAQNYVIVRVQLANGVEGIGEAAGARHTWCSRRLLRGGRYPHGRGG